MIQSVLANDAGAARDIVVMNAGAALYVGGVAESIEEGVEKAAAVLASGAVMKKLEQLVALTQEFKS